MDPMMGLMGGLAISGMNVGSQMMTNAQSTANAQEQMRFQERMSSTAYSRAADDMRRAGLNPMMMFGHGAAASSPGGASPELKAPSMDPDLVNRAVHSATERRVADATIENLVADAARARAQEATERGVPAVQAAQIGEINARTGLTNQQKAELVLHEPVTKLAALGALDVMDNVPDDVRKALHVLRFGGENVHQATKVVSDFIASIGLTGLLRGMGRANVTNSSARGRFVNPRNVAPGGIGLNSATGAARQRIQDIPNPNYKPAPPRPPMKAGSISQRAIEARIRRGGR